MADQPIENYGIIGDMHTVALVGMNGSIDWFCFPHFDAPSVFARILDDQRGGFFQIAPVGKVKVKQLYWPATNVLVTRFLSPDGVGEVTDYMPVGKARRGNGFHSIVRRVSVVRGSLSFVIDCYPAFNYARDTHQIDLSNRGACFRSPSLDLGLSTSVALERRNNGVHGEFRLQEGDATVFILTEIPKQSDCEQVIT